MPLTKINLAPGFNRATSDLAAEGGWVSGDKVRFVAGFLEKIGGWSKIIDTAFAGKCRGLMTWTDANQNKRTGIGTHTKLYYLYAGVLTDITPLELQASGTLTDPFDTVSGDATVTVNDTAHGQASGDVVYLSAASAVGGLTISGYYVVTKVDADSYTIESRSGNATSTVSSGGGSTTYEYFRGALANPFDVTSGSDVVVVNHAAHGRQAGDTVLFDQASSVGGVTIDGDYTVTQVTGANSYTITHSASAASTVSGGGGTVEYRYEINIGRDDAIEAKGYGVGTYGAGTWGTARSTSILLSSRTWMLDQWGQNLIACHREGGIYEWNPDVGGRAVLIRNAPINNVGAFVTEERILVALGPDGDKLRVEWSDQRNNTLWTAASDNQAGGEDITGGNKLIGGVRVGNGTSLIWTDTDAFTMLYTGDNAVYSIRKRGNKAGLIGPHAYAEYGGIVYWMTDSDFRVYTGGFVDEVPRMLAVRDYVFGDLNTEQKDKVYCGVNGVHQEVWWFYPSAGSTENDRYVAFNVLEQVWYTGGIERTAYFYGADRTPIGTDADGYIYDQETGVDADGGALLAEATSGYVDLGDGGQPMRIDSVIPDFDALSGAVTFYILTKDKPQDAEVSDGPYTVTSATSKVDVRASGRQVALKVRSNEVGGDFRLGVWRLDIQPNGRRR